MKNSTLTKLFIFTVGLFFTFQSVSSQALSDTVEMGADYTHDVYYNIVTGDTLLQEIGNWDLGFTTEMFDFTIFTNDGSGVRLYTYPDGDIFFWDAPWILLK